MRLRWGGREGREEMRGEEERRESAGLSICFYEIKIQIQIREQNEKNTNLSKSKQIQPNPRFHSINVT